ncbi:SGNH/GDSL hydrolase family protein [Lentzea tibetensis]|uniref:SGNH/GDSL hydrolase family protein n=1 Tax=Lentzea tibetensis TaxID=2591470 RepID=A0A563ELM7_9PSEU|nr:SGNH/GDSL hydrolase family protein [Lentzea tibetensis]TWP48162.1 SGNH/GDSL hydrolase family protein [Lentzea tibetensis]
MTLFAAAVLVGTLLVPTSVAPEYVALGDSYASGVGAGGTKGPCRRSDNAYPALYAKGFPSFTFAACTGATTADVVGTQSNSLTPATTLVTVTAGGNDLGFVDVMTTCTLSGDKSCVKRVKRAETYIHAELPKALDATYAKIKQLAPNARLVVVGYPRLFEPSTDCRALSPAKRTAVNAAADVLNDATAKAAANAGATYVDVRAKFSGHGVCSASPWINGLVSPTSHSYHPNKAGQQGYWQALTAAAP